MTDAWRRVGISPFLAAGLGMAAIAMLLSRGAGSGWLVVVAAAFIALVAIGVVAAVAGLAGLNVKIAAPTDATVGETLPVEVTLRAWIPQLRTITLRNVDGSVHAVRRGATTVMAHADRRSMIEALDVEVRTGTTLGVLRPAVRRSIPLPTALAIGPRPTPAALSDALGFDAAADVRSVRNYVPGDAARLVHWRSTARRGELMVRELEAADHVKGTRLVFRVVLSDDHEQAEAAASRAAGLAIVALDAGLPVQLLTRDVHGPRLGEVRSRRDVGRQLAAAVAGDVPPATADERTRVVEVVG